MKKMGDKLASNPSGLIMYNPLRPLNMPKLLGREFGKELVLALLAVFLLAQTRIVSFVGRVGFVTIVGLVAAMNTNVSYWIWSHFQNATPPPTCSSILSPSSSSASSLHSSFRRERQAKSANHHFHTCCESARRKQSSIGEGGAHCISILQSKKHGLFPLPYDVKV